MKSQTLLGPQTPYSNLVNAVQSSGAVGPIVSITAGWRDSEGFEPDRSPVDFVAGKPLDLLNLKRFLQQASDLEQNRTKDSTDDEAI